jgi:hypothetical protein
MTKEIRNPKMNRTDGSNGEGWERGLKVLGTAYALKKEKLLNTFAC